MPVIRIALISTSVVLASGTPIAVAMPGTVWEDVDGITDAPLVATIVLPPTIVASV
jgi:ABC-type molybdate transport system permease subunit